MKIKEIIKLLATETNANQLHDLLIDCGKKYPWTAQDKNELKNIIVKFCDHSNQQVRSAAIRTLCFYWGMEEFRKKAWEMFSNKNDDDNVRADALMSWSSTYRNHNNLSVIKQLYSILKNKAFETSIRESSYWGIFGVSSLLLKDWPKKDIDWDHFDRDIDWKLVEKLIEEAQ